MRNTNGICHPCVMGWCLAGKNNSSATVAAAVITLKQMCFGKAESSPLDLSSWISVQFCQHSDCMDAACLFCFANNRDCLLVRVSPQTGRSPGPCPGPNGPWPMTVIKVMAAVRLIGSLCVYMVTGWDAGGSPGAGWEGG